MPIYPYICGTCGHEFDKLQKVSDDPDKHCPECGEESLRRKVTAAAFHLKGTGLIVSLWCIMSRQKQMLMKQLPKLCLRVQY